jgi:hypothetical protein
MESPTDAGSKRGEMERDDYCNEKKAVTVKP